MKTDRPLKRTLLSSLGAAIAAAMASSLALLPANAAAAEHAHMQHDHSHHIMPSESDGYQRTRMNFRIPDVDLVDSNGVTVALAKELNGSKPVLLNFIFTSCGAICPVMSATFARVQAGLGPERDTLRMLSISIDPEHDTPAALKAYAGKYGAGPQWRMLTGSLDSSIKVQRAFGAYRGDKMNHVPMTFLRKHPSQPWVRIEGFASANDLLREYRLLASR